MDYNSYLKSEIWKDKRLACLRYYGYRCAVCNSSKKLDVHHRTYERVGGEERPSDLIALCEDCHKIFHVINPEQELVSFEINPKGTFTALVSIGGVKKFVTFETEEEMRSHTIQIERTPF